jgi:hypothetical protein
MGYNPVIARQLPRRAVNPPPNPEYFSQHMIESVREFWDRAMAINEARWVITIAGFVVSILIALYFVKLVRDLALGHGGSGLADSSAHLTNFQKLRDEGKLNEDEFKRLKESIPSAGDGRADPVSARTNESDAS